MKLLFCIKAMNNHGGGAERVLADVANGLVARQHDVGILTYEQPGGQSFYPLDSRIQRIELGIGSTVAPATVSETLQRIVALRRQVLAHRPDVVIGFMHSIYVPLGVALLATAIPLIASEHSVPKSYQTRPKIEWLLLQLTPLLTRRMTCVSEAVRQAAPLNLQTHMVVIPNPITLDIAHPADPIGLPNQPKIVLSVGRLEPEKDYETLIHAFARVSADCPDWRLRIVGEGSLRSALEKTVKALDLAHRVQLPGSTSDIAAEYQTAQLFVMSSRYESFGLTTAEALGHGLAAIGFAACPGINQLIQSGQNGVLVPDGLDRVTALATTLKTLMLDDQRRKNLSDNRHFRLDGHDLESVLKTWENLLQSVTVPAN